MPDLASIGTVLASIKTATDIAKLIKDSGSTLEQAEIKLQIAELISSLADAKIELTELQAELNQLRDKLNRRAKVKWLKPYYMVESTERDQGPYCPTCYDSSDKLIRLQGSGKKGWRCSICKDFFKDSEYQEPSPIRFG